MVLFHNQDKECLGTVLEVVELGVSGSKSVGKPGEPIKMKDEKELKPASMRVRDAADALLTTILEQVFNFFFLISFETRVGTYIFFNINFLKYSK